MADDRSGRDRRIGDREIMITAGWLADQQVRIWPVDPDPILDTLFAALALDPTDPAQRAVVSDALEERGRPAEAGLLRSEGVEIAVLGGLVYDVAAVFGAVEQMRQFHYQYPTLQELREIDQVR
jgi:uncharacterized protein (TIGR02996 family)